MIFHGFQLRYPIASTDAVAFPIELQKKKTYLINIRPLMKPIEMIKNCPTPEKPSRQRIEDDITGRGRKRHPFDLECIPLSLFFSGHVQWPFQEPIYWSHLPYIIGLFFRPLMIWLIVFPKIPRPAFFRDLVAVGYKCK